MSRAQQIAVAGVVAAAVLFAVGYLVGGGGDGDAAVGAVVVTPTKASTLSVPAVRSVGTLPALPRPKPAKSKPAAPAGTPAAAPANPVAVPQTPSSSPSPSPAPAPTPAPTPAPKPAPSLPSCVGENCGPGA